MTDGSSSPQGSGRWWRAAADRRNGIRCQGDARAAASLSPENYGFRSIDRQDSAIHGGNEWNASFKNLQIDVRRQALDDDMPPGHGGAVAQRTGRGGRAS